MWPGKGTVVLYRLGWSSVAEHLLSMCKKAFPKKTKIMGDSIKLRSFGLGVKILYSNLRSLLFRVKREWSS
jgi:hypothetical protein